jgi:hypothetical protein
MDGTRSIIFVSQMNPHRLYGEAIAEWGQVPFIPAGLSPGTHPQVRVPKDFFYFLSNFLAIGITNHGRKNSLTFLPKKIKNIILVG